MLEYEHPDSQVIFFAERDDGTLSLRLIYELGPRSRVWSYDIDVGYRDGAVSWDYHEGSLNAARDTMRVSKDYRGDRSEWLWVRDREADAVVETFAALTEEPFEYELPPSLGDGWECAEPEAVGVDGKAITRFLARVSEGEFGDIHGLLLARHGSLVVEEYFADRGSKHGPFVASVLRTRVHHLASISKSLTSTLVGIAIERGLITSVRDPVVRYLPAYASLFRQGKEAITIEHLLSMSSGLEWRQSGLAWSDARNDAAALWRCADVIECVLRKPLAQTPGRRFVYSNGSAAVVGAVLENATGMDVTSFADSFLFGPLGITDYLWTSYPDGTLETDGGLALRPRDLAKIGQAFLDGGSWQDTPVVSADWVAEATEQRFGLGSTNGAPLGYGFFWMQTEFPTAHGTVRSFFHPGDGEQLLMVIPELDLVVVFTGGAYGTDVNRKYHAIVSEYVVAAVDRGSM